MASFQASSFLDYLQTQTPFAPSFSTRDYQIQRPNRRIVYQPSDVVPWENFVHEMANVPPQSDSFLPLKQLRMATLFRTMFHDWQLVRVELLNMILKSMIKTFYCHWMAIISSVKLNSLIHHGIM